MGTHYFLAIFYVNPQYYTQGYNKNRTTLINVCNIAQNIDIIRPISSFTLTGSFHYVIVLFCFLFVCSVAFVCKFYDYDQASYLIHFLKRHPYIKIKAERITRVAWDFPTCGPHKCAMVFDLTDSNFHS